MEHEHPIVSQEFRLNTPVLMAVVKIACFKILMRKTGVVFTGEPRIGKTRCCEALVDEIPKRFPHVYTLMIPATNTDKGATQMSIVHQLIELEGVKPAPRATYIQRRAMLLERLKLRAAGKDAKQIVLLIDELQRLSPADYTQLSDIYNKLRAYRITLTVISFAMPAIEKNRTEFLTDEGRHIIGRFLSEIRPLFGITSQKNLATVLSLYDTDLTVHPKPESFTKNVLPNAYAAGFRMVDLAEDIWREMSRVASGKYTNNLPMEHVTQTIAYLFLILEHEDHEYSSVPNSLIVEAIAESNFKEFCRTINTGEK